MRAQIPYLATLARRAAGPAPLQPPRQSSAVAPYQSLEYLAPDHEPPAAPRIAAQPGGAPVGRPAAVAAETLVPGGPSARPNDPASVPVSSSSPALPSPTPPASVLPLGLGLPSTPVLPSVLPSDSLPSSDAERECRADAAREWSADAERERLFEAPATVSPLSTLVAPPPPYPIEPSLVGTSPVSPYSRSIGSISSVPSQP